MSEPRQMHRLFGLSWVDFFQGTSVRVETEIDLSLKQQFLDLVLIHCDPGDLPRVLPDGFEILGPHNLVTFISLIRKRSTPGRCLNSWATTSITANNSAHR
jgi:hypothetical protein